MDFSALIPNPAEMNSDTALRGGIQDSASRKNYFQESPYLKPGGRWKWFYKNVSAVCNEIIYDVVSGPYPDRSSTFSLRNCYRRTVEAD